MESNREPAAPRFDAADAALVARAKAGDEAALRTLFDRHAPRLRALVKRRLRGILRRKVGESDVVQEAYLTAHLRLSDFEDRDEGSFGHWLGQILEHKIRDALRSHLGAGKRDVRQETSQGSHRAAPEPAGRGPSPSLVLMRGEERSRLQRAMEALSGDQRLILRMAHDEGLPLAEVARRLGRNADAVYKQYGRAVEALTERLGGAGGS